MRISLPKGVIRKVQRAVVEFDLLAKGDKVLIGLSGGKDSTFLLYALSVLTKHLPFPVELAAMTIDLGFKEKNEMDFSPLEKVCDTLDIPYNVQRAELADDILNNPTQNPCARCSYFRRAIIHNYAKNNGYNKVAFAHHYDDAVETFLMSILYSGQVNTFVPKTYLDKTGVTVIRPLVYMMEKDIMGIANKLGIEAIPSPCPLDGYTKRAEAKQLIKDLRKKDRYVFEHLAAAMREGRRSQLWPPEFTKEEIRERTKKFWYGEKLTN